MQRYIPNLKWYQNGVLGKFNGAIHIGTNVGHTFDYLILIIGIRGKVS